MLRSARRLDAVKASRTSPAAEAADRWAAARAISAVHRKMARAKDRARALHRPAAGRARADDAATSASRATSTPRRARRIARAPSRGVTRADVISKNELISEAARMTRGLLLFYRSAPMRTK